LKLKLFFKKVKACNDCPVINAGFFLQKIKTKTQMSSSNQGEDTKKYQPRIHEAREILKGLSRAVKPLVKQGAYDTVNEAVIDTAYKNNGHEVFKKFSEWKQEGRKIKKGSKGFPVWARPKDMKKEDHPDLEDEFSFFPICYLFSNAQVE
jgi:hypothetical protein